MENEQYNKIEEKVCNLNYLNEMMGGKKHLIIEIMDAFLKQVPEELQAIEDAINKTEYHIIKNFTHTMKSSVSIMGISVLTPVLQEMEDLGGKSENMERIKQLNEKLKVICSSAIKEIEIEKRNSAKLSE